MSKNKTGELIFKLRGIIPIPFFLLIYIFSKPTKNSVFLGVFVIFVGEVIRIWAAGYINRYRTSSVDAPELVTYGPYGYVRNPLYIGNFFIGLGISVMSNIFIGYILFFILYFFGYSIIIPLEESFLREKWKDEYVHYSNNVPRLIPKFRPYKRKRGFDFYAALKSEQSTFLVELIIIVMFLLRVRQ